MSDISFSAFSENPCNSEEKVKCLMCGLTGARREVTCSTCTRDWRLLNFDVEIVETKSSSYVVHKDGTRSYKWP